MVFFDKLDNHALVQYNLVMWESPKSKNLKLDGSAMSASKELPAFLARPKGAPVYHGFPVVAQTMTDGWCFGTITEYESPDGCNFGDAFVVAPDGSRAGLVWEVGNGEPAEILKPDDSSWGVYAIYFPMVIRTTDDLVTCFRVVLPNLQKIHERVRNHASSSSIDGVKAPEKPE